MRITSLLDMYILFFEILVGGLDPGTGAPWMARPLAPRVDAMPQPVPPTVPDADAVSPVSPAASPAATLSTPHDAAAHLRPLTDLTGQARLLHPPARTRGIDAEYEG